MSFNFADGVSQNLNLLGPETRLSGGLLEGMWGPFLGGRLKSLFFCRRPRPDFPYRADEFSCRSYFLSQTIERQSDVTVGSRLARRRLTINGSTVNLEGLRWTSQKMCQFGVHKKGTI